MGLGWLGSVGVSEMRWVWDAVEQVGVRWDGYRMGKGMGMGRDCVQGSGKREGSTEF